MEITNKKEFGELIRQRRLAKPISLRKFAELIGISPTYLSRIERGEFDPPSEITTRKIAQALSLDEDELLSSVGKIASDVSQIIIDKPIMADFLRAANTMSYEAIQDFLKNSKNKEK